MYCYNCGKEVGPVFKRGKFHPLWFIMVSLLTGGLSAPIWLIVWIVKKQPRCPICNMPLRR